MSRTTYANLFSKIGTTYGSGDGSATFNLPNLTDRFIQGHGTTGTVKAAGLPNITGNFFLRKAGSTSSSYDVVFPIAGDSFAKGSTTDMSAPLTLGSGSVNSESITFDASKSNSIYGKSTTVQPPALTMRFAIFAGHSALFRWIRQS